MRISLSTLMGIAGGVGIIGWGVATSTSNYGMFWNEQGFAIVVGGTLTAAFVGFRWRYILKALLGILTIFIRQSITPKSLSDDVGEVVRWAKVIQDQGKKGAEIIINETDDHFVRYIMGLLSTGYSTDEIRKFSETSIEEHYFRSLSDSNILNNMAGTAPAFGMVGTLIGLIVMLSKMDDPSNMGPGLSVALMTTLYGVLLARFIFQPASTKVKQKLGISRFREYVLLEGVCLISDKKSSFYIQDRLNAFLDRNNQYGQSSPDESSHSSQSQSKAKG